MQKLTAGFEIDSISLSEERFSVSIHKSLLRNLSRHLLDIPLDDRTRINHGIRALGASMQLADMVMYGKCKAEGTQIEQYIDELGRTSDAPSVEPLADGSSKS